MKNNTLIAFMLAEATTVVIGLLVAFGLNLTAEQVAAIMAAAGFVGLVLALVLWAFTVSKKEVVERLIGSSVVAGAANDIVPEGTEIRTIEDARP